MATKINSQYGVVVVFAICTIFSMCRKDECIGKAYSFKTFWKVAPEKDSINVGDTITFASVFDPYDYNSNTTITPGTNVVISTAASFSTLIGGGHLQGAVDSFDFIQTIGNIYTAPAVNPSGSKQLIFLPYGSGYQFQFSIIAKKKGVYSVGIADAIFQKTNANSCDDGGGVLMENNNLNNNLHYYRDLYYLGAPVPPADSVHGFSFKVR